MRWIFPIAAALALTACLPPTERYHGAKAPVSEVRVAEGSALDVHVTIESLIASDPAWRVAFANSPKLTVTFDGAPVPCVIRGAGDGPLEHSDVVSFTATHGNRHSPWLAYRLRPAVAGESSCRLGGPAALPVGGAPAIVTSQPVDGARPDAPPVSDVEWERWRKADYVVFAPQGWMSSLTPLIRHRTRVGHTVAAYPVEAAYDRYSGGNPRPEALREAIAALHKHSLGRLHYVLLVGDVSHTYAPDDTALATVPTFYETKVHYPGYRSDDELATDHPYGVLGDAGRKTRSSATLAVGRLPARTEAEARLLGRKIVRYETDRAGDNAAWSRRLIMYGGPANYGKLADTLIETTATYLLNDVVPYDYDLDVVFAKANSPYATRFDALSATLIDDLEEGALFAAYFGHGQPWAFDHAWYRGEQYTIGGVDELSRVNIPRGAPVFLSFTCHTGRYDLENGDPSLAEAMAMAENGPIAVFASSRASHPYPNLLYAQGFIDLFLAKRPKTLGDGVLALKKDMRRRKMMFAGALVGQNPVQLQREHESLYNLLGDPALRLRYPETLAIRQQSTEAGLRVRVASARVVDGTVRLTLETERKVIRGALTTSAQVEKMALPAAFEAMAENHIRAMDKVVTTLDVPLVGGLAEAVLPWPAGSDKLILKALATDGRRSAAGHTVVTR